MNLTTLGVGIASGLGQGGVYALIAVSLTLVISATGFFNFALESLVALGGICTYLALAEWHLHLYVAVPMICIGGAVAGAVIDFIAHRPLEGRTANVALAVLLATTGLSIAIDAAAGLWFGDTPRDVPPYVSPSPITIFSVPIPVYYVVMIAVVAVVVAVFEIVLRFTAVGRGLQAMQEDREGVSLLGFNVKTRTTMVFALSGLFAALAGFLITPVSSASPGVGSQLVIPAFAALAIGGFGSFRGSIGGGLVIGLIVGIVPLYLPAASVNPILLVLIVAVLLIRPSGLFGARAAREL